MALLARGAETDVADHLRETPLHRAAAKGHDKIVDLLIQSNANLNVQVLFYYQLWCNTCAVMLF